MPLLPSTLLPLLALAGPPVASGAELGLAVAHDGAETTLAPPPTAPPISLDVQDADIRSVLRLFGEHAGVNFVLGDDVQGTVTASLDEVPWDQALAAVLLTQGLAAVPMGAPGEADADPAVWVVQPLGDG